MLTLSKVSLNRVRVSMSILRIAFSSVDSAFSRSSFCASRYCLRSDCTLYSSIAARLIAPRRWILFPIRVRFCSHSSPPASSGKRFRTSSRTWFSSCSCSLMVDCRTSSVPRSSRSFSRFERTASICSSIPVRFCSCSRMTCSTVSDFCRTSISALSTSSRFASCCSSSVRSWLCGSSVPRMLSSRLFLRFTRISCCSASRAKACSEDAICEFNDWILNAS